MLLSFVGAEPEHTAHIIYDLPFPASGESQMHIRARLSCHRRRFVTVAIPHIVSVTWRQARHFCLLFISWRDRKDYDIGCHASERMLKFKVHFPTKALRADEGILRYENIRNHVKEHIDPTRSKV
jgi:hypothetical protein